MAGSAPTTPPKRKTQPPIASPPPPAKKARPPPQLLKKARPPPQKKARPPMVCMRPPPKPKGVVVPPRNKQVLPAIFMKSLAVARMMQQAAEQNRPEVPVVKATLVSAKAEAAEKNIPEVVKAAPVPAEAEVSEMVPVKAVPVLPAAKTAVEKMVVPKLKVKAPAVPPKVKVPPKAKAPPRAKVPPKAKVAPKAKVVAKASLKAPKGSVALMEAKQLLKRVAEMKVALEGAVNALKHKAAAERLDKIRKKAKSPTLQERFLKVMEAAGGDAEEPFSSDLEDGSSLASSAWEGYEETEVPSFSGEEYSVVEIEEELDASMQQQQTILDLFERDAPTVEEFMSWRDGRFAV